MRTALCLTVAAVALASASAGCNRPSCAQFDSFASPRENAGAGAPASSSGATAVPTTVDASRTVLEADIVQLDHEQNRIYAMSKSGSLAVVDASQPGTLALLGKTSLSGEPFEMYCRGDVLLTMSNRGVARDGSLAPPLADGAPLPAEDPQASALVTALDVSDPAHARQITTFRVAGEIADSRIDTFRIESTASMPRVGHGTITLPRQEGLKTVRFDGIRAYAITFNETDPLFAIDLSDAAQTSTSRSSTSPTSRPRSSCSASRSARRTRTRIT